MIRDLEKAKARLAADECTCVLCCGEQVYVSRERGVKPLLEQLEAGAFPRGFSAVDRVVGRAAAFLYVLLGAREIYAEIMSEPARQVLAAHGIVYSYASLVPAIRNRTGDGFCPMESAVREIDDPEKALAAIRQKLAALSANKKDGLV